MRSFPVRWDCQSQSTIIYERIASLAFYLSWQNPSIASYRWDFNLWSSSLKSNIQNNRKLECQSVAFFLNSPKTRETEWVESSLNRNESQLRVRNTWSENLFSSSRFLISSSKCALFSFAFKSCLYFKHYSKL